MINIALGGAGTVKNVIMRTSDRTKKGEGTDKSETGKTYKRGKKIEGGY